MTRRAINDQDWEKLSAYLDGELETAQVKILEKQLETNPDIKQALEDLRHGRTLLRSQGKMKAPRNFTLSKQTAGLRQRAGFWLDLPGKLYPVFQFSAAMASFLFLLTFVGNILVARPLSMPSEALERVAAPAPALMEAASPEVEQEAERFEQPAQPKSLPEEMFTMQEYPYPPPEGVMDGLGGGPVGEAEMPVMEEVPAMPAPLSAQATLEVTETSWDTNLAEPPLAAGAETFSTYPAPDLLAVEEDASPGIGFVAERINPWVLSQLLFGGVAVLAGLALLVLKRYR